MLEEGMDITLSVGEGTMVSVTESSAEAVAVGMSTTPILVSSGKNRISLLTTEGVIEGVAPMGVVKGAKTSTSVDSIWKRLPEDGVIKGVASMGVVKGTNMSTSVDSIWKRISDDGVGRTESVDSRPIIDIVSGTRPAVSSTVSITVKNNPILGSKVSMGSGNSPILISSSSSVAVVVVVVAGLVVVVDGMISRLDSSAVSSEDSANVVVTDRNGGVGSITTTKLVASKK